ncbi:MAG: NAD(P)H-dependent oxidoreductase [Thermoguttaceae bacterium]|nr:NAD(P)H-dependent oxidoreductase [Thermoguttaceae bacterium]
MERDSRRRFLEQTTAAMGVVAGVAAIASGQQTAVLDAMENRPKKIRIVALNGSPRRDKTTVEGLTIAMEAARQVAPERIETEMIHLIDCPFCDVRLFGERLLETREVFDQIEAKLANAAGILVGSPVHNGGASALISIFFGQVMHTLLQGKVAAALGVGGARNGGQEHVVQTIHSYLMHEGMILPGTGMTGRSGALCWNQKDTLASDETGCDLARRIGCRVATLALALPSGLFT